MVIRRQIATVNISLPTSLRAFVELRVAAGGYGSVSEYFRELVRRDEANQANARLEALVIEGLDSGPSKRMTKAEWAEIRREVSERVRDRVVSRKKRR